MSTFGFKVQRLFGHFGIGVTSNAELVRLQSLENTQAQCDIEFLSSFKKEIAGDLLQLLKESESQLRQDLFVISVLGFKKKGYFVEFGATDGKHFSNTYLLENHFLWTGILAEPAKIWHDKIERNRPKVLIDKRCVWKESGKTLTFRETRQPELSTLAIVENKDEHAESRLNAVEYIVETISLMDLLDKYQAPADPDYLSIDTEGSEYEILKEFNFDKYNFKVITCEHNFSNQREKINELLSSRGYVRVFKEISKFDDWYIRASFLADFASLSK